ncbi:MAG TPA: phage baseplate assembly protein V [Pyrinomonadaceae bacterium]|jgi:phage baseplate assembly protein V
MSKIYGVVTGLVVNVDDPLKTGRVQLRFPWLGEQVESQWARVATMMAGKDRGSWFMPEVDDEVLVAFEHGNVEHPFVLGFLWNGKDKPPRDDTKIRVLKSLNGHEIEITDPPVTGGDKGHIRIKDAHGNVIELSNGRISITAVAFIDIKAPQVVINGRPVVPAPSPI